MDAALLDSNRASRRRSLRSAAPAASRLASASDMMALSMRFMSQPEAPLAISRMEGDSVQPAVNLTGGLSKQASLPAHSPAQHSGWHAAPSGERRVGGARGLPQRVALGVAAGTFSLYGATQCVIKSFHYLRRRQLREMMLMTLPVLEELGVQHWVDFGSLLGLVRSGDLILHDNDVDVVVLDPDWPQLQEQLSARLGHKYRVGVVRPSEDPSVMWLRVYCPLGMMDIYGAHDRGTGDVEIEIGRQRLLDLPKAMVLPTRQIAFR